MHVLVIPGTFPGPYNLYRGIFFQNQVQALADNENMTVGVIAPDIRSSRALKRLKNMRLFGSEYELKNKGKVQVYRKIGFNLTPSTSLGVQLLFYQYAKKLFEKYIQKHGKPDLIHAHISLHAGHAAQKLSLKYNIPYVITEHSSAILKNELSSREKKVVKQVLRGACRCIVVSNELKNKIDFDFEVKSIVIPNVVKLPEKKQIINSNRNPNLLLSVGTLIMSKGFADLLKAFQVCLQKRPELKLKIVGDGGDAHIFKNLAKQLNILDRVEFTGALPPENVHSIMKTAGVFISASKFETFGVVLVEAAAAGTPIVSTNSGGPKDIVTEVNGVICPVNDYKKLADAVLKILENPEKYVEQEIIDDAYERFNPKTITQRIIKNYEKCLKHL